MEEPDDDDDDNDDDLSLLEAILAREPLAALRAIVEGRPHLVRARLARLHGITPLHLAAHVCLPFESVRFLYRGRPRALRETYRGSLLPIHCLAASPNLVAVVNEDDNNNDDSNNDRASSLSASQQQQNHIETARFFIEEWPGSLRERDENRRLPLHRALRNRRAPLELIRLLVQSCPETVRERGGPPEQWTFPLHDAVTTKRKRPRKLAVVQFVFEAWPNAINARDAAGRLPLHVAAAHPKIAPSVLRFLVDRGPASALQQRDSKLRVPLLLAASAGAHEHARILVEARPASARERNHEGRTRRRQ
jgi:ankyrin repeat protein